MRSRRRGLPGDPDQLHPERDRWHRRGVLVHGGRTLHDGADSTPPGGGARPRAHGSSCEHGLSPQCVAPERASGRGHPDAQAPRQLHPSLEDDALRRPERRRVQRRELQRQRVAPGDRGAVRELHRRGHLFHQRHQHHQQLSHQVRRPLDRHGVVGQLREHHAAAHAAVRHLPEGSNAEFSAGRELPDALGQRLQG